MRSPDHLQGDSPKGVATDRLTVVLAGPSSAHTVPGIVVSQIVRVLAALRPVLRIEVNLGGDFDAGIFRAPSLAAAHVEAVEEFVVSRQAPSNAHHRLRAFREWIGPDVETAVAFVWPGIDNVWITQFLQVAREAGARTVVVCVSLPKSNHARVATLADTMVDADLILVGDAKDAAELNSAFGSAGPRVETHRALSLLGRNDQSGVQQITAFLPRNNTEMLSTLLAAFDAIPEAWIASYRLQVVMRYSDEKIPEMIAGSYYADSVELVGGDVSSHTLEHLCQASSALIIADPLFDSRVYSIAVECGVAIVVLASANLPAAGRGYVGALLADERRPVSVHVALSHALRLAELQFPLPEAWDDLAQRLLVRPGRSDDPRGDPKTDTRAR
jgi:hypothetical protein